MSINLSKPKKNLGKLNTKMSRRPTTLKSWVSRNSDGLYKGRIDYWWKELVKAKTDLNLKDIELRSYVNKCISL
jgi:hypothetical protein